MTRSFSIADGKIVAKYARGEVARIFDGGDGARCRGRVPPRCFERLSSTTHELVRKYQQKANDRTVYDALMKTCDP